MKRSVLLKIIRKALRIVATSGRHFNARASPRRGLKAPSKENIRVACHPRMSTRATLALSIGVANIYMPPSPPLALAPSFGSHSPLFGLSSKDDRSLEASGNRNHEMQRSKLDLHPVFFLLPVFLLGRYACMIVSKRARIFPIFLYILI